MHHEVVADVLDKIRSIADSLVYPDEAEESAAFVLISTYCRLLDALNDVYIQSEDLRQEIGTLKTRMASYLGRDDGDEIPRNEIYFAILHTISDLQKWGKLES